MEFPKKLRAQIIAHLRRIGYRNIYYKEAAESAHVERGKWRCNECKQDFKRTEIHMDHIEPVIEVDKGFVDFNTYIERLFLGKLQPLCLSCHQRKSLRENEIRRLKPR